MIALKSIASPNVEFTGFITDDELLKLWRKAKVHCQPSRYESFGMGIAEAMNPDCYRKRSNPKVVEKTGFYAPYWDEKAIAGVIKKVLNAPNKLGKKHRKE
jgi:glycosyltransferase involved in cell wall biosynthesis